MGTTVAQNIILAGGLALQVVMLVFLVKYVRATKGIEKASNEQSEGLSKPVVTVRLQSARTDEAIVEGLSCEIAGDQIELTNIGTGPALKLRWRVQEKGEPHKLGPEGYVPYLEPGKTVKTSLLRGYITGMDEFSLECSYASVSNAQYVSTAEFSGTLASAFSVSRC